MSVRFPTSTRRPLGLLRRVIPEAVPGGPEPPAAYVQQGVAARIPVSLVILTVDRCALTFGQGACTATGTPCYNSWGTCMLLTAYSRTTHDLKFSSIDAPIPFDLVRPYVKEGGISLSPTEIKSGLSFDGQSLRTVSGRLTVEMRDEPDGDVGVDPYLPQRVSAAQGTYWKKFLARNRNYYGRGIRVYEGFLGDAENAFTLKWSGTVENVSIGKGTVKIEAVDILRDLAKVEIPPKVSITTLAILAIDGTAAVSLSSVDGLAASGYIKIGEEIIAYSAVNSTTKQLTGLTRAQFGTTAEEYAAKAKVGAVRYIPLTNPWDLLVSFIRTDAGRAAAEVDEAAFEYWRDWPGGEAEFSTLLTEPVKLDKLITEIVDLIDARIWVNEDMKITVRRNIPNHPGRSYIEFSDEKHLIHQSASVDLNEKSRITRMSIYWDKTPTGDVDEIQSYGRIDIGMDADAESAAGYGSVVEKKVFCRWIDLRSAQREEVVLQHVKNLAMRQVSRYSDAQPLVTFEVDLKDAAIRTGDYLKLTTDELLHSDGSPIDGHVFQVVKRDRKKLDRVAITAMKTGTKRVAFICPSGTPTYENATPAQREYGFISDAQHRMSDGSSAYTIW